MIKLNENINRIKTLMGVFESEEVDSMNVRKGEIDQDPIQVQGDDGMDDDSDKEIDATESEISEEGEVAAAPSGGGGGGYPTVTKWESGVARGEGNPIDFKKKWESGLTRGKGNTLL
jgi:hypothetical protein